MKVMLFLLMLVFSFQSQAIQFNFFGVIFGVKKIKNYGSYRAYSNGQYGKNCNDYRNPSSLTGYQYIGQTGDGIYRIKPDSGSAIDVYCDMTTNGGGWTLVTNAATTSSAYATARDSSVTGGIVNVSSNWNIMGDNTFNGVFGTDWLTTDKIVKITDLATSTTYLVPGTFVNTGTKRWTNSTTGTGYSPVLNFDGSYGSWGGYGYSQAWIGLPNVGRSSWCSGTTDLYVYMNADGSKHPGVSSWQGGCDSNFYWKNNLYWQVYTK